MRLRLNIIGTMLVLALALIAAPSALRAQPPCVCDHYTVTVDAAVGCDVTICYRLSPFARPICVVIAPGGQARIPCPVYDATIRLCDGTDYVLIDNNPVISICTPILQLAPACCVRVCHGLDPAGCSALRVSAAPCASINCP